MAAFASDKPFADRYASSDPPTTRTPPGASVNPPDSADDAYANCA